MSVGKDAGSGRTLRDRLQSFDLEDEVSRLCEEEEWQKGRRNAITLRKGGVSAWSCW